MPLVGSGGGGMSADQQAEALALLREQQSSATEMQRLGCALQVLGLHVTSVRMSLRTAAQDVVGVFLGEVLPGGTYVGGERVDASSPATDSEADPSL